MTERADTSEIMPDVGHLVDGATLDDKIAQAHWLVDMAIHRFVTMKDKELVGRVVLFSGGNDSTILAHLMRERATHFAHCNTGIGIEQTRQFVRDVSAHWGIPLIEKHPGAGNTFRDLVLDQGFPGPAHHWKMYQRLKERGLRQVRGELVKRGRSERVLFLAGRRRAESSRRTSRQIPEMEQQGSVVWVSPLVHWTTADMKAYRERFDVPRNEVSDMIHMSGECLCGAFAGKGELDEIGFFFPEVRDEIQALEAEVAATGLHPPQRCRWGWGADPVARAEAIAKAAGQGQLDLSGPLCSSCDARFETAFPSTDRST